jgi:hypothetical protein
VVFVVNTVAVGQVLSERFGFPLKTVTTLMLYTCGSQPVGRELQWGRENVVGDRRNIFHKTNMFGSSKSIIKKGQYFQSTFLIFIKLKVGPCVCMCIPHNNF